MLRLGLVCFCLVVLLGPVRAAEDAPKADEHFQVDRPVTLSPRGLAVPVLRFQLLPVAPERKPGDAAPIYLRFAHNRPEQTRRDLREKTAQWNELPLDKLPRDEVRKFLTGFHYQLEQMDLAARRKTCDWNYTLDVDDIFMILLPDAQEMRQYAHLLVLKARLEIAEGHYVQAVRTLETGFSFAQQLAEGPFLINSLIALAVANQMADTVLELIERSDSPNLFWSLSVLPRPLVDLRKGMEFEQRMLDLQFPDLAFLDRPRSAEEWDAALLRVRTGIATILRTFGKSGEGKEKENPWQDFLIWAQTGAMARKYLIETLGLPEKKVNAMPQGQVLLTYLVRQFQEVRDESFKAAFLPYPEARAVLADADKRLKTRTPRTEAVKFALAFLPSVEHVQLSVARLERKVAALRVLEALRLYAARKGGLPDKLSEVTEVPVPPDPGTGKPFEYSRDGDTATLISQIPGDKVANTGLRYRITLRK
jgi:hypothetical protein